MAMQGRGGDNTLVHMSKTELPYLNMLAKSSGHPQGLPVNPETGLPEANILKSILPVAGAILGGMFLPGVLPAFLGQVALAIWLVVKVLWVIPQVILTQLLLL